MKVRSLGIDSGMRQGCIMSPWLDRVMKEVKRWGWEEEGVLPGGWERVEITWPLVCK